MGVMEFERRKLRRKPLSDCTNIPTTTTTTTTTAAAAIKPPHNSSSKTSSTGSNANHAQYPSLRPPQLNTPEDADVATIKNRRLLRGSDKRKEVAETVPFSGSLARRIRIIGEKLVKVDRDVALSTGNNKQNSIIRPRPSTPPRPNASAIRVDSSKNVGSVILCSRRLAQGKTRDKGQKAAETGPFTCPPVGRIRSITKGNRLVEEHGNVSFPTHA